MEPLPYTNRRESEAPAGKPERAAKDRYWLHALLFLLTLASTTYSGGTLAGRLLRFEHLGPWWFVPDGIVFALSLLLFLTVHEFGHYIASRRHGIDASLPYYIPMPIILFGTLGAVIRIREPIPSIRKLFDVGASGPLAGFVVALGLLAYAVFTLPGPEYLMDLPGHEELKAYIAQTGAFPDAIPEHAANDSTITMVFGKTLLYTALTSLTPHAPPMYEMYHYPVLLAGWLGLFFTALNLLPVGQLDGGHILYALVGPKWHARIARVFLVMLLASGAIGYIDDIAPGFSTYGRYGPPMSWAVLTGILYFYLARIFDREHRIIAPVLLGLLVIAVSASLTGGLFRSFGYSGWLVFTLLIVMVIKVDHPPVLVYVPLTRAQRWLGILSMIVFVLCFSIRPIYIV